jgi:cytochrome c556
MCLVEHEAGPDFAEGLLVVSTPHRRNLMKKLAALVFVVVSACGTGAAIAPQSSSNTSNRAELQASECINRVTEAARQQNGRTPVDAEQLERDLQACLKEAGLPDAPSGVPQTPTVPDAPKPPEVPDVSPVRECFDKVMKAAEALEEKWKNAPAPKDEAEAEQRCAEVKKDVEAISEQAKACHELIKQPDTSNVPDTSKVKACFDNVKKLSEEMQAKWSKVPAPKDEAEAKKMQEEIAKDRAAVEAEAKKCEELAQSTKP